MTLRTLLALLAAVCVVAYTSSIGGARGGLGLADFAACVAVLAFALAAVAPGPEGFAPTSVSSLTDLLLIPHLDRLIKGLDKGAATGPFERSDAVVQARFKGHPDPGSMVVQYRQLSSLLCRMAETDPKRFAELRGALGVGPPLTETGGAAAA